MNNSINKISIITVVKNGMPFLKSAIESFKLQSYSNKELIIVYAPSYDGTETYLKSLNDSNIIIKKDDISKTKFGSINKGIELSTGNIFGLLHSDDIFYSDDTLSLIIKNFELNINCLYGNVIFSKKDNICIINRIWKSKIFNNNSLRYGWMPPHTSIFLRKDFFENDKEIYNEKYPISGDYYFILKIFHNPNLKSKFLNNFITLMRDGGDSTKISNLIDKLKEDLTISKLFFKYNYICVICKILQKVFQIKIIKIKLNNNYINKLNKL